MTLPVVLHREPAVTTSRSLAVHAGVFPPQHLTEPIRPMTGPVQHDGEHWFGGMRAPHQKAGRGNWAAAGHHRREGCSYSPFHHTPGR